MSTKFATAMNASATTWNNATSLASPDPTNAVTGRMSLFFKGVRGLVDSQLYGYMDTSAKENLADTFVLAFNLRDVRGGKGERDLGRKCLVWLFKNYTSDFMKIVPLLAEYGRYDDLLQFFPGVLTVPPELEEHQKTIVHFMAQRLKEDRTKMDNGEVVSMLAKWTPTEKDSMDRKTNVFATLASAMNVSTRRLRKYYNTPLRAYLKVVEQYICSKQWDKVNYNHVPGQAMKRLRKTFEKHDGTRFLEWRKLLQKNDPTVAKVNAKTLYPHEIVRALRIKPDEVLEAQWRVLVEETKKLGSLQDTVVVCDTSSSMSGLPMDISVALGMLISEVVEGPFHGHVITFNSTPEFVQIRDGSAFNRLQQVMNIPWGGSTNLQGTFELILRRGQVCGLTNEDMPKRLIIVSDMQFNQIESGQWNSTCQTNFEAIDKMYMEAGYTRPQIVFWNVNGKSTDFPVTAGEHGTSLVSGASPSVLKGIITGVNFSPVGIMRQTLDDERYDPVRKALSE